MSKTELYIDTITFGKYKGSTLKVMLKDLKYCKWLINEEWFERGYEYLYNIVKSYNPREYFINNTKNTNYENDFLNNYTYFNLKLIDNLDIDLSDIDIVCYKYYLSLINDLKYKIIERLDKSNPYDIKSPTKWLQKFEKDTNLKREDFKNFICSYDLPNLTYIIEDIKKEGGIEYNGAKSFVIAKKKSLEQEEYWENILKDKYGDEIGIQFKFHNCFFDFINISSNTIYECKIGLKDYNDIQYQKYLLTLTEYNIIYLISNDCIININKKTIYTTNISYYLIYKSNIFKILKPSKLDMIIIDFDIIDVDEINKYL